MEDGAFRHRPASQDVCGEGRAVMMGGYRDAVKMLPNTPPNEKPVSGMFTLPSRYFVALGSQKCVYLDRGTSILSERPIKSIRHRKPGFLA